MYFNKKLLINFLFISPFIIIIIVAKLIGKISMKNRFMLNKLRFVNIIIKIKYAKYIEKLGNIFFNKSL